ncbi:D-beta-hydroxybutyrate dehydrogenase [Abditibacteriota bacterium]|nr:D-beta-hydroxybutyrate dehydrogenase [Abditibacteriota bacterium]
MNFGLKDKVAVVTGSTAGIGFASAVGLAREGAHVVINGRQAERVESAIARLKDLVPDAVVSGVAADLGGAQGVDALIGQAPDADILVNNLGIFEPKPFEEISDEEWLRFFEVNVLSGIRLSRYYLPRMKAQNWGRIIFVSSESAVNIPTEMIHYGMTKTAQLAVARGMAETTTGTGVTVNCVLPGPTASEGVETFVGQLAREKGLSTEAMEKEFFERARPSSILKRFIEPEEVANMIVYVSSQVSVATNGAALRVEGGLLRSIL